MSFVEDLLTALIAHTTVGFIHQLGHGDTEVVEKVRRLEQLLDRDTTLTGTIRDSASYMNNEVKSSKALAQGLRAFFTSAEVHAVARQVFAFRLEGSNLTGTLQSVRQELRSLLSMYLGAGSAHELDRTTDEVLDALLKGCQRGLQVAIDKGYLSAHEAASSFRHRLILDELSVIKDNVAFLLGGNSPSIAQIDEFQKLFRREVGHTHKFIKPPHFDASKRIPIDKLYVTADFVRRSKGRKEQAPDDPTTVPLADFLEGVHRVVVLGSPGGGKSTLVSKLAHDFSLSRSRITGRDMTPIVVTLRQYGLAKQERGVSILEFIEMTANSDYSLKPPPGAVKYLLLNGRAAILFDGLDELLETSDRQRIAGDIESFCRAFPSVPVLVTSREIGYAHAPLDETMFDVVRLAPFNDEQVQDYVRKWFSVGGEFTAEHQKQRVTAFLAESEKVSDLRSVPLLLALMCNIYRGEGYIPKNRPDVYAKCAEMLFERWDKSRGIPVALPFDAHLRPAMMYLAHWIYTSEKMEQAVTETQLVSKATDFLWPRRFEDRDQAEGAAKGFVEFCRGRAWVFTDTGLTRDDEALYQFTHRTFLEYFTAAHLVRTTRDAAELMRILLPRLRKGEWEVVAHLTCQIADKQKEGAGDEILTILLEARGTVSVAERWNLTLFAIGCLEFIVPAPRIVRAVAIALVRQTLEYPGAPDEAPKGPGRRKLPHACWEAVKAVSTENRAYFSDAVRTEIQPSLDSEDPIVAYPAWEVVFHVEKGDPQHWLGSASDNVERGRHRIKDLSEVDIRMCRHAVGYGILTFHDLAKFHGVKALFTDTSFLAFEGGWAPAARWSLYWLTGFHGTISVDYGRIVFSGFDKLGGLLIDAPTPWVTIQRGSPWDIFGNTKPGGRSSGAKLQGRALFAGFALTAAALEMFPAPPLSHLREAKNEMIEAFRTTYLARFEPQDPNTILAELQKSGLNAREIQFATDWSSGKTNLVNVASKGNNQKPAAQKAAKTLTEEPNL